MTQGFAARQPRLEIEGLSWFVKKPPLQKASVSPAFIDDAESMALAQLRQAVAFERPSAASEPATQALSAPAPQSHT